MSNAGKQVATRSVMRVFWQHIRPHVWVIFSGLALVALSNALGIIGPLYLKEFFDILSTSAPGSGVVPELMRLALTVLAIYAGAWLLFQIGETLHTYYQPRIEVAIQRSGFGYLLGHSHGFFANNFIGSLVRRVRRLAAAYVRLDDELFYKVISTVVLTIGILIVVAMQSWIIFWLVLAWTAFFITFSYVISKVKLKTDERRAEEDSKVTAVLADTIANVESVRLFTGEEVEQEAFKKATDIFRKWSVRSWRFTHVSDAVSWAAVITLEIGVLIVGLHLWDRGLISLGDFVLFQSYMTTLYNRIWGIGRSLRHSYEAIADAKEMVAVLETPHAVTDNRRAKTLEVKKGRIEYQNVTFAYNQTRAILKKLNLTIKAGERVALVGPSGAGKSTLVKLLFRLSDIQSGKILIDGQRLSAMTQKSVREQLALVPQDAVLFHRTILENIRYGRRDATDEEVIEAAKQARCHAFIERLPEGYNTYVGERGVKLSGGERQRVGIARAILKDAPILVLDEATSSLDSESEALIQEALEELMKDKTTIVIAHRLSTILKMDRIIVMEGGQVVDQGTHRQLSTRKGLYKKLWDIQAGGFLK